MSRVNGEEYHVPKVVGGQCGCKTTWTRVEVDPNREPEPVKRRQEIPLAEVPSWHEALTTTLCGRPMRASDYDIEEQLTLRLALQRRDDSERLDESERTLLEKVRLTEKEVQMVGLILDHAGEVVQSKAVATTMAVTPGRVSQLLKSTCKRFSEYADPDWSLKAWFVARTEREFMDEVRKGTSA